MSSLPIPSIPSPSAIRSLPSWTLRVSGNADVVREDAPALTVTAREIVHVLTKLLADERVHGLVVTPHAREVRAHVSPATMEVLTHGELVVDVGAREVRAVGERVSLTRRELDLIIFLMRNPNRAWSRAELLDAVWGSTSIEKQRTVDVHVRRVRGKLASIAFPLETLVGVGYRFTV